MTQPNTRDVATARKPLIARIAPIDLWLVVILAVALLIRLYDIGSPLSDFSSWRQIDTASIARNFVLHDFNIFHPQLDYDGPGPNYSQLELQITTAFIALLFKFVGMRELYARIIPVLFSLGAIIYLYLLIRHYSSRAAANMSAFLFAILPMSIYYSRAVQPEAAMLFFGIGSLYYASVWAEKQTRQAYAVMLVFGILSVLAKLPNIFLFLPVLVIARERLRNNVWRDRRLILYFGIILAVTAAYFGYLGWLVKNFGSPYDYRNYLHPGVQTGNFVANIMQKHILPELLTAFQSTQASGYFTRYLPGLALTPIGFILLLIGFLPLKIFGDDRVKIQPLYAWLAAILIYMLTLVAIVRIDYYLVPLLPIAAFFMARSLIGLSRVRLKRVAVGWVAVAVIVGGLAYQSYGLAAPLYEQNTVPHLYGADLNQELRVGEPVVLGSYNPVILFYSGHRGWRATKISLKELRFLESKGAGYFIPINAEQDKALQQYLATNLTKHVTRHGCVYYDLKEK
ncbi:MAG TPA: glycosyltransferase family 39 protein [Candidatus Aquicultor sp.]|jgi:4-amino-4-deoxy-L-arabinose transferase-like glycosyltransferase